MRKVLLELLDFSSDIVDDNFLIVRQKVELVLGGP